MKLALKIASSILATVSLVFFCIGNFADSKIEMMLDFMGFDGFVGIINLLAFVTFVVFAVAYIMLEIGIWLKGTGLRSASLVLVMIAAILTLGTFIISSTELPIDTETLVINIIILTLYVAISIVLLATKRSCGIGSIITTGILIVAYITMYLIWGTSTGVRNAILMDSFLLIAQLLMNIASSQKIGATANNAFIGGAGIGAQQVRPGMPQGMPQNGPQGAPQGMPVRSGMPQGMPQNGPQGAPQGMPVRPGMPQGMPQNGPQGAPQGMPVRPGMPQGMPQNGPQGAPQGMPVRPGMPQGMPQNGPQGAPQGMPVRPGMPQGMPQNGPQGAPQGMQVRPGMPQGMPQNGPQGAPQGMPVRPGMPQNGPQGAPQGMPQAAPQAKPQPQVAPAKQNAPFDPSSFIPSDINDDLD